MDTPTKASSSSALAAWAAASPVRDSLALHMPQSPQPLSAPMNEPASPYSTKSASIPASQLLAGRWSSVAATAKSQAQSAAELLIAQANVTASMEGLVKEMLG